MMSPNRFQELLNDPASATKADVEELEAMSAKYEWFPTPKVLLAQIHHLQNTGELPERLREAAIHSGDRTQLFNQINFPKLREIIQEFERELEPEPESVALVEDDIPETVDRSAESKPLVETADNPELLIDEEEVKPTEEETADETAELEREIILEAVKSVIEKEVAEDMESQRAEEADSGDSEVSVSDDTVESDDPFADWLLNRSRASGYEVRVGSGQQQARDEVAVPVKPSAAELIDRFIKNEPKITPGKADSYTNTNVGAAALVEDENFVTETLAMIYARQGKVAKAKKAYKLLALKYPEKSVYFAAQIKKLEKGEI